MQVTAKHLNYRVKRMLNFCEDFDTEKSSINSYIKLRRSATSSRARWYTLILAHKRNQVMEVPRIGSLYRTQKGKKYFFTKAKEGLTEQVTPFFKKTRLWRKMSNSSLWQIRWKQDFQRKLRRIFEENNFEFTPPGTPQQNGMVERVFPTIYSWMCAMMAKLRLH